MDRLWRQPEVAHHRNSDSHQRPHGFGHGLAAFELHSVGTGLLHHPPGISNRVLDRHLIGQEGHVDEDQGLADTPHHRGAMIDHLIHRGVQGCRVTGQHLIERVAHQQHIDRAIQQPGEQRVVAGQHGDLLTGPFLVTKFVNRDWLLFFRHGVPRSGFRVPHQ